MWFGGKEAQKRRIITSININRERKRNKSGDFPSLLEHGDCIGVVALASYAHIHIVMVFHDHHFTIFRKRKGSRWIYRIKEKEEFRKSYHSFVDVQAVRKLRKGIRYITKYLSKYSAHSQTLTLALCWLFRKRS